MSFGRRSQLKLNVCMDRTPEKDEDAESFFSVGDAAFEEGEVTPPKQPHVGVDRYVRKNEPQSAAQWDGLRSLWAKTQRTAWKNDRKDGIGYTGFFCARGDKKGWVPEQSATVTTASLLDERELLKVSLLLLVPLRVHCFLRRILHCANKAGVESHGGLVVGTALRRVYSCVPLRQCAFQRLKFF